MPKFLTIGYGDQAGYDRTAPDILKAAHAHDDALRQDGVVMGVTGNPVQVRNTDGAGVQTQEGPYLTAALPVAGFAIIEADSLEAAIEMVSQSPCAVAQGVIEVWPFTAAV